MTDTVRVSQRIGALPPYLFAEIDRLKDEARSKGVSVIDFGVGDPDRPTPEPIVNELCVTARDSVNHQYPSYNGLKSFRKKVADYYADRAIHGIDPDREVVALLGSKEGIAHLPLALIDRGDVVLIPDPGYPVYHSATMFAGGESYFMPLTAEHDFLPDLASIPEKIIERTNLMFLNYPNNPTSGLATIEFFERVVELASKYGFPVCHDASYLDITFDGYRAPSILEVPGAKDWCIEMISFSKTFNMTGWRLAAAVGSAPVLDALLKIKMNIDSGVFNPVQYAGIAGLDNPGGPDKDTMAAYEERRRLLFEALDKLGWNYFKSQGTFYVWVSVPDGKTSLEFTKYLLQEAGIVVTPGTGFGEKGEGFFRFSLTLPTEDVREAARRLSELAAPK